jgi:hypothetical protein
LNLKSISGLSGVGVIWVVVTINMY